MNNSQSIVKGERLSVSAPKPVHAPPFSPEEIRTLGIFADTLLKPELNHAVLQSNPPGLFDAADQLSDGKVRTQAKQKFPLA
ncbi:hypothetical protein GCM10007881_43140 [Mesorhizobium huakuii]|nr:hypothetical protein GCM10007881_43140 [Mesorhizobium huakuii]